MLLKTRKLFIKGLANAGLVAASLLSGCQTGPNNSQNNVKEFEGIITYAIYHPDDRDSTMYGDTLKLFYSHGNIIKQYNGTSPKGLKKEIFLTKNTRYYMNMGGSDTQYAYDITRQDLQLVDSQSLDTPTNILGHPCKTILFKQTYKNNKSLQLNSTYSYSPDILNVHREYFTNWKFGNFNTFINNAGCLYLRFESDIRNGDQTIITKRVFQAVNIQEQVLDPALFIVDTSRIKEFRME